MTLQFDGVPELEPSSLHPLVAEALKRVEENKPPYPTEICKEYPTSNEDDWRKSSRPNFLGWKGMIGGWSADSWTFEYGMVPHDVDLSDIGYIGIWRSRIASGKFAWCVVPSMIKGESLPGDTLSVGKERIQIGAPQEEIDAAVRKGYDIIKQMVTERGEYQEP